jgi:hypothetical protein
MVKRPCKVWSLRLFVDYSTLPIRGGASRLQPGIGESKGEGGTKGRALSDSGVGLFLFRLDPGAKGPMVKYWSKTGQILVEYWSAVVEVELPGSIPARRADPVAVLAR